MPVSVKETRGQFCSHCLMQFATVRLYGFNGLDRLAANRSQRRHFERQKTVPEQVGFRFSPTLLFVVLRIYLRACDDGL